MSTAGIAEFTGQQPSDEQHWRSIVLFGRNVALFKFALAKSLLEIAGNGQGSSLLMTLQRLSPETSASTSPTLIVKAR